MNPGKRVQNSYSNFLGNVNFNHADGSNFLTALRR